MLVKECNLSPNNSRVILDPRELNNFWVKLDLRELHRFEGSIFYALLDDDDVQIFVIPLRQLF